jgi:hypothetical protein
MHEDNFFMCFQDLPEHFEDNIKTWMDNFLQLLSVDNKLLKTEVLFAFHRVLTNLFLIMIHVGKIVQFPSSSSIEGIISRVSPSWGH